MEIHCITTYTVEPVLTEMVTTGHTTVNQIFQIKEII